MRFIQKEVSFSLTASETQIKNLHTLSNKGQLVEYYISANDDIDVYILRNNIQEKKLLFEGVKLPLYLDVNANDLISVSVANNTTNNITVGVMLLIQEF